MKKLGLFSIVLAPLAIAACAAQLVAAPGTKGPEDLVIASSARPVVVASGGSTETIVRDAYVKAYEHVASAEPGAPITLVVQYGLADPSWSFDQLTVEVDEASKVIHVKPTMRKQKPQPGGGVVVPAVIVDKQATTQFVVKTPGRYRLVSPRYLSGELKAEIVIGQETATPVLSLRVHGGLCPKGACERTLSVMSDGSYTDTTEAGEASKGQLPAEKLEALVKEIERADFEALKAKPFTGTCPTAYDGSETVYTFHTAKGEQALASCTVEIDAAHPLIAAADAIRAHVDAERK